MNSPDIVIHVGSHRVVWNCSGAVDVIFSGAGLRLSRDLEVAIKGA